MWTPAREGFRASGRGGFRRVRGASDQEGGVEREEGDGRMPSQAAVGRDGRERRARRRGDRRCRRRCVQVRRRLGRTPLAARRRRGCRRPAAAVVAGGGERAHGAAGHRTVCSVPVGACGRPVGGRRTCGRAPRSQEPRQPSHQSEQDETRRQSLSAAPHGRDCRSGQQAPRRLWRWPSARGRVVRHLPKRGGRSAAALSARAVVVVFHPASR